MTLERRTRGVLAIALLALAALANPWTVGYVATDDGSVDQVIPHALLLFGFGWLVLAALHALFGWVERASWVAPVGYLRIAVFCAIASGLVAGTYWRVVSYREAHAHTEVRAAEVAAATPEQRAWAEDFYRRSLAAALKNGWFDFDNAMKQGFQPDRLNHNHFPNLEYMFDDVILDPERPEWLVYDTTPQGKVLMALMFFTRELDEVGPTPGGPIAQWHKHNYGAVTYCAVKGIWTVGVADRNDRCAEGVPVTYTPEMFHVWFIDHPLGRFTEMKIVPEPHEDDEFDWRLLHPVAVHFAIALFAVAVLLDLAARVLRKPQLHQVAWVNLALSAVAALLTVSLGMTAETLVHTTPEAHDTLDVHKLFAFWSLGAILLLFVWRYFLRGAHPVRGALLYSVLSVVALGILGGAGYYGGEMVYRHGAAVKSTDVFLRDRYWKLVNEVYRRPERNPFQDPTLMRAGILP